MRMRIAHTDKRISGVAFSQLKRVTRLIGNSKMASPGCVQNASQTLQSLTKEQQSARGSLKQGHFDVVCKGQYVK